MQLNGEEWEGWGGGQGSQDKAEVCGREQSSPDSWQWGQSCLCWNQLITHTACPLLFFICCGSISRKQHPSFFFPPRSMTYMTPCSLSWRPAHTLNPNLCCTVWGFLSAIWSLILKVCTWHFQKVKWSKTWLTRKRIIWILQSEHR